jgi:hypothetical protein
LLNDTVDNHGQRSQEVGAVNLGVEEDLGGEEALVTDINGNLSAIGVRNNVLSESSAIPVILAELLDNIGTHVTVLLLDFLSRLERRIGLASVS